MNKSTEIAWKVKELKWQVARLKEKNKALLLENAKHKDKVADLELIIERWEEENNKLRSQVNKAWPYVETDEWPGDIPALDNTIDEWPLEV